jgi:hypothetical protein
VKGFSATVSANADSLQMVKIYVWQQVTFKRKFNPQFRSGDARASFHDHNLYDDQITKLMYVNTALDLKTEP